ncbi:30S ribosomal protein S18 [Brachyspira hyodysenteriae]|uniref:30S ribosomal protein S18 n=1 Tax=Brachyspira hyodysenteriae TaxID=159 RepID=UPI0022CD45C1|nr:30S ribosomal protein S18 [Brachyspira hyodysenteriae]MCZ9850755.1 30S ribosomal protein S18 [Brachyspira hyodysenteriae]MCZ9860492.1 30S ribosomal protein S18 [Brachyspira hyodysenteriae]MCZ9870007.1 30S ribosomal protein S18 [Brachyspira hyodysenteriae]MCZ9875568.1 30S ribosomal protein S18 [Brachyspira hyodysenteriae]MCZ9879702.1 30S ribosomal protein S18 [Brachyspira hyodysenteriae]
MDLENTENVENNNNNEEEVKAKGERKAHFNKELNEKDRRKKFFKKKVCYFCKNNIDVLDYKDIKLLKRYVKDSGKIIPKRLNGTCSKHQRLVTKAIKRARNIALLPYETRY